MIKFRFLLLNGNKDFGAPECDLMASRFHTFDKKVRIFCTLSKKFVTIYELSYFIELLYFYIPFHI